MKPTKLHRYGPDGCHESRCRVCRDATCLPNDCVSRVASHPDVTVVTTEQELRQALGEARVFVAEAS